MKPTFFKTAADFRAWLEKHHATTTELLVGFYKKGSGKPSLTRSESVDEALCFGWIDGIGRTIDEERYSVRFSPRRPGSVWSRVNTARVAALKKQKRMHPAGQKAFDARDPEKTGALFAVRDAAALTPALAKIFRGNAAAWAFFEAQPPGYRRLASFFVISAKQDATRLRRLDRLIKDSASGRRIGILGGPTRSTRPTRPKRAS